MDVEHRVPWKWRWTEDQCEPEVGYRKGDGKGPKPSCKSIGEELCIFFHVFTLGTHNQTSTRAVFGESVG